ncbi:LysR family transcriptional regulator [Vitiosangium sp. GDMCC 1.1324]|uniref:LysR family transcriptional regulator n=1 Tax=Vitiosangium sp. (strain GDMCC 1.1324) TaxID=2138576 RepID=UPI00130D6249|nr:LysR substrate-binding domain-containing protein [Vitiosangium sp. GDMCC 1.1324]
MYHWDDLRVFLAAHRGRSHAGAARLLGLDATTVGRRLTALESALGARLFNRTRSGLSLTREGAHVLAAAERIEEQLLGIEREVGGSDVRLEGLLRLTAGEGLMSLVLMPHLLAFREQHPGIDLELRTDPRPLDLARREADVALRLFRPREEALVVRRLGTLPYGLYGSEAYFARRGRPRTLRELPRHDFVTFDASLDAIPEMRWLRRHVPGARYAVRANSTSAILSACASGHGLAAVATAFAATDPRLVRVVPAAKLPSREVWSAVHQDLRGNARVRALVSWLADLFTRLEREAAPAHASQETS